jgi:hypothetical protein
VAARVRGAYCVWVRFDDGCEGVIDLDDHLDRGCLLTVRDPAVFRLVEVQGGTLAWPNGVDLAPEVLHARLAPAK